MPRRITSQDISWFLDLNGLGRLNLEPAYQRRSVWTRRDRQFFLDTIFNNYPSPAIFLHKELDSDGNATYHVVDGKQRLETILLFVDNRIPVRDNFGDVRLNNKKWRDLREESELKKTFLDYQITVEMLDSVEVTVVNEIFNRLNQNSRKLERQEMRHARFDGWFVNRAESEADEPFWKTIKISTAARIKRMQDVQFISELMISAINGGPTGFDQDAIDTEYARLDAPNEMDPPFAIDEFNSRFGEIRGFIQAVEEESGAVTSFATNLAHFYSLWSVLSALDDLPSVSQFSERYSQFMGSVFEAIELSRDLEDDEQEVLASIDSNVALYVRNIRGATTDLAPRTARHSALRAGVGYSE